MGEITIKVPQNIKRSFEIDSRRSAEEIIKYLERRSVPKVSATSQNGKKLKDLKKLVAAYRTNPDSETCAAQKIADEWRNRWNR